jgi:hypothetical protein
VYLARILENIVREPVASNVERGRENPAAAPAAASLDCAAAALSISTAGPSIPPPRQLIYAEREGTTVSKGWAETLPPGGRAVRGWLRRSVTGTIFMEEGTAM